jgi:hypothetical protein
METDRRIALIPLRLRPCSPEIDLRRVRALQAQENPALDPGVNLQTWQTASEALEGMAGNSLPRHLVPELGVLFEAASRQKLSASYQYPNMAPVSLR